jgi:hypothetical protein
MSIKIRDLHTPTCQDRQWLDDDEAMATGPICGAPATQYSCTAAGPADAMNACKAHKCRCAPRKGESK